MKKPGVWNAEVCPEGTLEFAVRTPTLGGKRRDLLGEYL